MNEFHCSQIVIIPFQSIAVAQTTVPSNPSANTKASSSQNAPNTSTASSSNALVPLNPPTTLCNQTVSVATASVSSLLHHIEENASFHTSNFC